MNFEEMRRKLLSIEKDARDAASEWESRYASAHMKEVVSFMWLALVQLEYAELALNQEPERHA